MKKKGCLISIGITTILMIILFYLLFNLYDTDYEKVEIPQKIGGVLICDSKCYNDIHDWQYIVDYSYKTNENKIFKIGIGSYYAREWKKDEQLEMFDKWFILKTGDFYGTDKVIIGNFKSNKCIDYKFTPETILKEELWKKSKIKPLLNYCCAECFIAKINDGFIEVKYKYRIEKNISNLINERILIYKIDKETGKPNLIKIKQK